LNHKKMVAEVSASPRSTDCRSIPRPGSLIFPWPAAEGGDPQALYRGAEILVLDEPTAVLTPQEVEDLFQVLRTLKSKGTSIVFITHKIKEVLAVSDRVSVLRRGKKVGTKLTKDTNEQELAEMMVARVVLLRVEKGPANPGPEVLRLDGVTVKDQFGQVKVNNVSLSVRRAKCWALRSGGQRPV